MKSQFVDGSKSENKHYAVGANQSGETTAHRVLKRLPFTKRCIRLMKKVVSIQLNEELERILNRFAADRNINEVK